MLKISLRIAGRTLMLLRRIVLYVILLLALAVAGLILALRYTVLPEIEHYHDEITQSVGRAIGLDVEIGRIEADWYGIGPHLRLSDIRILDKQKRTTLELQRVDAVVSWMTLLTAELRLSSLEIDQPDLMVKRDTRGVLQISGIELGGKSSDNNFSNMLLNQSRIVVRGAHISWLDEQQEKPLLVFDQVNLLIENIWNYHRFAFSALPPAELSTKLDVRGDFYGKNFDDLRGWSGEIYAQLDYADLAAWKKWLPLPDALKQGTGALRGWLGVEEGKLDRLTADLALRDVQTRLGADLPPLDIHVLRGRLGWHDVAQGFEFSTHNFSLKLSNNFTLKPTDVFVRFSKQQDLESSSGEIRANLVELESIGKLMDYLPLERMYKTRFAEFSPQGRVENLQARWQLDKEKQLHYKIKGRFRDLSMQRTPEFPGFSGLSGEVDGSESRGTLSIASRNLKLDAPKIMPEVLVLDMFSARSSWEANAGGIEVNLRNVVVENADLAGTAYGSYQSLQNSPGKLDLNVHLTRASVPHAGKYIPNIALGSKTQAWLNKALLDGQSNDFSLRIKGDLNNFPFVANRDGIFRIQARAKGVSLEYDPDWPRIDNGVADLLIQGNELMVTASSATTAAIRLKNVKVSIPDFLSNDLMLLVRGEAEAENVRALEYIQKSPVRGYLDGFTDDIVASGNGKLGLKLDIPLQGELPLKVAGDYRFIDSDVEFSTNLPTMRKVNGNLLFTESGVSTQNISAQILGGPAKLVIESGAGGSMNIKLGGKADFAALRDSNPLPLLHKLTGDPAWKVEIGVQNKLRKVVLNSSLKGLKSDLPAPFYKLADETANLHFEMKDLSADHRSIVLQLGSLLNANLLSLKDEEGDWSLERGNINFGGTAGKPDRDGLWLAGTLPHLSLQGWEVLAGLGGSSDGEQPSIAGADLLIQNLSAYGNSISNMHVRASAHNNVLSAQLVSKELNGELSWQGSDGQAGEHGNLVARIRNLDLTMEENGENAKKAQPEIKFQTKSEKTVELPKIDLAIDRLSLKGRALGRLEVLAQHHGKDYHLDHLRLNNSDGALNVDGVWKMPAEGAETAETQANVKLDIYNAGNVLARSGFPNSVKNGSGKLDGSFTWTGSPMMYSKAGLNGKLNWDTGKGQFLQIDPGIGKLLSILSLQALPKRIALDFEDVFSKGFEFDKITGSADVRQGVLFTDNLKIEGSSAKVSMTGQIDLVKETQNLRVRIVPTVGNSVALISALVANPAVGAGVYIAGKILNDPLGQMVSFQYDITGNWADPAVNKVAAKKKEEAPEH